MIREEIDYNATEFLANVESADFNKSFVLSKEDTLKNAPKGYDVNHPQIEYLKLKSFIAIYKIEDKEFFKASIVNKLTTAFKDIQGFVLFLRKATTI